MTQTTCLYTEALDAGDRFVAALVAGDAGSATEALNARDRVLRQMVASTLPRPSLTLQEQFRAQSTRIDRVLAQRLAALSLATADGARVAAAHRSYRPDERAPSLDTAPR